MNKKQIRIFYSKDHRRYDRYPDVWADPNTWNDALQKFYIIKNKDKNLKLLYF